MAMPIRINEKPSSGGILGAIGTVLGAIAAPFTGGASLAGVAAGAGIGKAAGGLVDAAAGGQRQAMPVGNAEVVASRQKPTAADTINQIGGVVSTVSGIQDGLGRVSDAVSGSPDANQLMAPSATDDPYQKLFKARAMLMKPPRIGGAMARKFDMVGRA